MRVRRFYVQVRHYGALVATHHQGLHQWRLLLCGRSHCASNQQDALGAHRPRSLLSLCRRWLHWTRSRSSLLATVSGHTAVVRRCLVRNPAPVHAPHAVHPRSMLSLAEAPCSFLPLAPVSFGVARQSRVLSRRWASIPKIIFDQGPMSIVYNTIYTVLIGAFALSPPGGIFKWPRRRDERALVLLVRCPAAHLAP